MAAACWAALTSGCNLASWARNGFKVGPEYCRPMAPVASEWIDYQDPRVQSEEADLSRWWEVFGDPTLNTLIGTAYAQNISLRTAGARILQARAARRIAVGSLFPQVQEAFGSHSANKTSFRTASVPPEDLFPPFLGTRWPPRFFENYMADFNLSWELDFWGRYRRAIEAADAELDASIESYDDALVILLAEVAASYVQYRTFEKRLEYARQNVKIQRDSLEITQLQAKVGTENALPYWQAKQNLEATEAAIPELETGKRRANNALCVLLGMPPQDLQPMLGEGDIPAAPSAVAVGIPADLLRRRPDVRRAERAVAAQSARIGIAESELYPHFVITGTLGVQADSFDRLFQTPPAMFGSVGPSFRWAILNYGRIVNNIAAQDARFQELAFAYQETVLRAGREAEDSLVAFIKAREQMEHLRQAMEAAGMASKLSLSRFTAGIENYTSVLVSQASLTNQQDRLAVSVGNMALSLVSLYRALGGGWEMRLASSGAMVAGPPQPSAERIPVPAVEEQSETPPAPANPE